MKWFFVLGVTLVAALMILYEWPRMNPNQKKEKSVLVILVAMEWVLAILLLFFPDLPRPAQMIGDVFNSLVKFL